MDPKFEAEADDLTPEELRAAQDACAREIIDRILAERKAKKNG